MLKLSKGMKIINIQSKKLKCSNPKCPYNLEPYSEHPQWRGLCLNCLDDERQSIEQLEIDKDYEAL
jgi:hypothetical protein